MELSEKTFPNRPGISQFKLEYLLTKMVIYPLHNNWSMVFSFLMGLFN
jgi:hypothetical protein